MRIFTGLALVIALVVAGVYLVTSGPMPGSDGKPPGMASVAMEPMDFVAPDSKGRQVKLSAYRGKPVLLNFWATWCPPCIEELPALLAFAAWAKAEFGLETVAVSVDQDWKTIEKTFAEKKFWPSKELPITILLNPDSSIGTSYGSTKYPESFFIDRNFKVIRKFVGPQNWNSQETKKWITEILAK